MLSLLLLFMHSAVLQKQEANLVYARVYLSCKSYCVSLVIVKLVVLIMKIQHSSFSLLRVLLNLMNFYILLYKIKM